VLDVARYEIRERGVSMFKAYEIDVRAFRAWLAAQPIDAFVGMGVSDMRCPVALWLDELYTGPFFVGSETIRVGQPGVFLPAPCWVTDFVEAVDEYCEWRPTHILAHSALYLLDGVMALS
jgi:hypothetical protein